MCVDCSNTINTLPTGSSGLDGDSSYIYVATATDSSGTDFALYENAPTQCWKAIKTSTTPISPLNASVFDGLWFDTCGTNGNNGTNGTNGREGVDGTVWTTDTGNPTSGSANNGDYYINETNGQVWLYDDGWVYQGFSLKGANGNNGADGADGNIWINGSGDPRGEVTGTTIGDLYLDNTTGDVYSWDGFQWNIVTTIMGPKGDTGDTGATGEAGATGDPRTITSNDGSVTVNTITGGFDLSIKHELDTFQAFILIGDSTSSTSESFPVVATTYLGIPDGGKKITNYPSTNMYYNNATVTGSTVPTSFGTFNRSTGVFTTSVEGTYLLTASIHLKPDDSTSVAWSSAVGLFGLGFCPSANDTDIICGGYQTINTITKHIDLTIQRVCKLNANYGIILKALNWTNRAYDGSAYENPDGIGFTITKLH
jgi:hypothetical protein